MSQRSPFAVGYVVKRYPRYSETFIVNEILAHEAEGLAIEVFSIRPPVDTHFQDTIARVRAPVHYLPSQTVKGADFWEALQGAGSEIPGFWSRLSEIQDANGLDVYQAVALARIVRQKNIRCLHAHFASSTTSVARLAARLADIPYTFTAHAKDIFHESVEPHDLRQKLRDAAAVITVSDFNVRYLRQNHGSDGVRVTRVYNGLDLERFPFNDSLGDPQHILAVGRLVEKKGFPQLVAACGLLAERGVQFKCQIIGTGEQEADLHAQIRQLKLEGTVELLGPRPQQEIIRLVRSAGVFAAPCVVGTDGNRDGLPTVLLEAMALGTPCVATDVTGIPEIVRHDETGLMVPQNHPEALADALERLMADGPLRARLARKARELIEDHFDVRCNAARLREYFFSAQKIKSQPVRKVC